jgi:hypothetical protein
MKKPDLTESEQIAKGYLKKVSRTTHGKAVDDGQGGRYVPTHTEVVVCDSEEAQFLISKGAQLIAGGAETVIPFWDGTELDFRVNWSFTPNPFDEIVCMEDLRDGRRWYTYWREEHGHDSVYLGEDPNAKLKQFPLRHPARFRIHKQRPERSSKDTPMSLADWLKEIRARRKDK